MKRKRIQGVAAIDWLIILAIFVVLAAIIIPSYIKHTKRAHYHEIVLVGETYRQAVNLCLQKNKLNVSKCNGGQNGVPVNVDPGKGLGHVYSINVSNGVITIAPRPSHGILATDTYILTPILSSSGKISWRVSGGGCLSGLVRC